MGTDTDIHTCSHDCERPECIRRQRDELLATLVFDRDRWNECAHDAAEQRERAEKAEAERDDLLTTAKFLRNERDELRRQLCKTEGMRRVSEINERSWRADNCELRKRIEDAAGGTVVAIGDDEAGQPRVIVHGTREGIGRGSSLIGRRVRLVVDE